MSEERLNTALAAGDPRRDAGTEQDILKWLAKSNGEPDLRCSAIATLVAVHARGSRPGRDVAVTNALRNEYLHPRLLTDEAGFAEDSRRMRAWILYQAGRLQDPRWVPFLLAEGAEALALPEDDGRGAAALRGLAELIDAVDQDEAAAGQLLRLAAGAASRPNDPRLAPAGPLIAFLRERLSNPRRLAELVAISEDAAVHAVLVQWSATALHEACERSDAPAQGVCAALIGQLVAEEAGRSDRKLGAEARAVLAARAPLHLVQGMAQRLAQQADPEAGDDLAAALLIASEVQAAHLASRPAASIWSHGTQRLCNEADLAAAEAWQDCRRQAVEVLLAAAGARGGKPAEREALLCSLASLAPIETASSLAAEAAGMPAAADLPRLEQVARHLNALLAAPGVDAVVIDKAFTRLAAIEAESIHRPAAATLAVRDPGAYLAASAALLERLAKVNQALADALIDGTALALQRDPERLAAAARSAALLGLAGAFQRLGKDEDGRHDRVWACLAPRDPALLARAQAALLATRITAQGPSSREVLRAAAVLPLVRDPVHAASEAALIEQLAQVAARSDEEAALFATRALAEQGSPGALAGLRRLAAAQPAPISSVAILVGAALADQPKP